MKSINDVLEWPFEVGDKTTSVLFLSPLAREPRRYLEIFREFRLTKPHEMGHSASLPPGPQQNPACLLSRALQDLAPSCHLVAVPQAGTACWLFSPAGCQDRDHWRGPVFSWAVNLALPWCRARWAESPLRGIFSPHSVYYSAAR